MKSEVAGRRHSSAPLQCSNTAVILRPQALSFPAPDPPAANASPAPRPPPPPPPHRSPLSAASAASTPPTLPPLSLTHRLTQMGIL